MIKSKLILTCIVIIVSKTIIFSQNLELKIKIPNLKNQQIILGHYFSKQSMMIPDDTVLLNNKGIATFHKKEQLPKGMYFIFLPNKRFFNILLSDNQKFAIENDTVDFIKNMKTTGDDENKLFADFQIFRAETWEKSNKLRTEYDTCKNQTRKKEIQQELQKLNLDDTKKRQEIINKYPNYFFSEFLKSTLEVNIPEDIKDQNQKFYYYRNNYFNQFDFKNAALLRSPVYENKLDYFLDKLIPQVYDSIIPQVNNLIENSRHNKELFRYMLVHLFNKYRKSKLMTAENVYLHIVEKFYLKDAKEWASEEDIAEIEADYKLRNGAKIDDIAQELKMIMLPKDSSLIDNLRDALETMKGKGENLLSDEEKIKNLMVEHKSNYPNISDSALRSRIIISELADILEHDFIPNFEGYISLHNQKSKYTILYFWRPDCSHCKEDTPKFSEAFDTELSGIDVTVMAVYLHKNINEWDKYTNHLTLWFDFVTKHNMLKWLNVWEPFGYENYRDKYNVSNAPVLYLLDEQKKIIAKNIGYEQAIQFIKELEKREN